jgi:hypothetical protein
VYSSLFNCYVIEKGEEMSLLTKLFSKKYDEFDAMLRAAALILPSLREGRRIEFYMKDGKIAMVAHSGGDSK